MAKGEEDLKLDIDNGSDAGSKKTLVIAIGGAVALVVVTVVVMLLILGGGSKSEEIEAAPVKVEAMQYYSFEPFVVSFADNGRQRYLQVGLDVAHRNTKIADVLKLHDPMIRSEIIRIINEQNFERLRTNDGRLALQAALQKRVAEIVQSESNETGIDSILFSNYVMQ